MLLQFVINFSKIIIIVVSDTKCIPQSESLIRECILLVNYNNDICPKIELTSEVIKKAQTTFVNSILGQMQDGLENSFFM